MAWNEDNVSEWRDMSTWNEDNVSEWRDISNEEQRRGMRIMCLSGGTCLRLT